MKSRGEYNWIESEYESKWEVFVIWSIQLYLLEASSILVSTFPTFGCLFNQFVNGSEKCLRSIQIYGWKMYKSAHIYWIKWAIQLNFSTTAYVTMVLFCLSLSLSRKFGHFECLIDDGQCRGLMVTMLNLFSRYDFVEDRNHHCSVRLIKWNLSTMDIGQLRCGKSIPSTPHTGIRCNDDNQNEFSSSSQHTFVWAMKFSTTHTHTPKCTIHIHIVIKLQLMCMCSLLVHLGVYRYMAQTNQNKCLQFLLCAAIFFFFSLQSINREWNSIGGKLKQSKNYPSNYWLVRVWWCFIGTSKDTYIWNG